MRAVVLSFLILSAILNGLANSAVIFVDDFCSDDGWSVMGITDAFVTTRMLDSCIMEIRDSGLNTGILWRSTALPSNYTLSFTFKSISPVYSRVGIIANLSEQVSGYAFTISSQGSYQLSKVTNGRYWPMSGYLPNPAILPHGVNTLTLHKIGRDLHLVCNGNYLEKITDSSYTGGGIGIVVSSNAIVQCDRITIDNDPNPGTPITCISDNFSQPNFIRWNAIWVRDSFRVADGGLGMYNSSGSTSILFLRGSFEGASLKAVASPRSGTGMYGIAFFDFYDDAQNSVAYKYFSYLVSPARRYAISDPNGSTMTLSPVIDAINGQSDTLELRFVNGAYDLYANGKKVGTAPRPANFEIEAAGLIVQARTSARFDDVRSGNAACIAEGLLVRKSGRPSAMRTNRYTLNVFDLRGRRINYPPDYRGASSGIYLVQRNGAALSRSPHLHQRGAVR